MRFFYLFLLSAALSIVSVSNASAQAKQGGTLRFYEYQYPKTLHPHAIIDTYSQRVAGQIFEGLFKFDPETLEVKEAIAESFTQSDDNKVYTFRLRQNVFFHNDPCFKSNIGRKLNAHDVVFAFRKLCSEYEHNFAHHLFYDVVKGAKEYYEGSGEGKIPDPEVLKVQALDSFTVQIELLEPNSGFLEMLARPETFIFPKEMLDRYGDHVDTHPVGTGAFRLAQKRKGKKILLERHENYHRKDAQGIQLPYLDRILILYEEDKNRVYEMFNSGKSDVMYAVPAEIAVKIKPAEGDDFHLLRTPSMRTRMLAFNAHDTWMSDPYLRKAISFAIDRKKIIRKPGQGDIYAPGVYGITPHGFAAKGYDTKQIKGYDYNPDSALYYFEEAGYSKKEAFGVDMVLEDKLENRTLGIELRAQLKEVLGIELHLIFVTHYEVGPRATTGSYTTINLGWTADHPSPEAFLRLFYGKNVPQDLGSSSFPNFTRYTNPEYDKLFEQGLKAKTEKEAFEYFRRAENLVMDDAPAVILWYDENFRLKRDRLKNVPANPMGYRDFSIAYFE